jgi:GTP-binding protein
VLVDLPGYGYARISKTQREGWRPMIEEYLRRSPQLRGIVHLLDARHDPTDDDLHMLGFLAELGVPTIVVLTKTDKLSSARAAKRVEETAAQLELDADQVIPFSATTGLGRDDLAEAIESLLAQPSWKEQAP